MTRGCRAAVDVAERLGFAVENPVVIQQTSNIVVWLRPRPVIAKAGTSDQELCGGRDVNSIVSGNRRPVGRASGEWAVETPLGPPSRCRAGRDAVSWAVAGGAATDRGL